MEQVTNNSVPMSNNDRVETRFMEISGLMIR